MSKFEFHCRMCGHCCLGSGGIVLSPKDIAALCEYLEQGMADFFEQYTCISNGKRKLIQGEDGYCVFFSTKSGCKVHPAKPDICRAWPFFRGNLEDPVSLDLARDFCPGIGNCSFDDFFQSGLEWLKNSDLINEPGKDKPNALINSHLLAQIKEQGK